MKEAKAPMVCGECRYWTGKVGNPNHGLHCSKYKEPQIQKDKKPFARKVKDIESIEENYPVAGNILTILKIIGLILFLIILFAFMWDGMEFAY